MTFTCPSVQWLLPAKRVPIARRVEYERAMGTRNASDVAKRGLCLELLLQRLGLELDEEDHVDKRDAFRKAWVSRLGDLEVEHALRPDERELLLRSIDQLTQEEVSDIEGRVIEATVILWALGRVPALPTVETFGDAAEIVTESGVLGDGSVAIARSTVAASKLRDESELRGSFLTAEQAVGDVRHAMTSEQMIAEITVRALGWVLGVGETP